eukprot:7782592-Lingulodinium_polyedra.AAC.1
MQENTRHAACFWRQLWTTHVWHALAKRGHNPCFPQLPGRTIGRPRTRGTIWPQRVKTNRFPQTTIPT